jgi:hypothetical protein
MEKARGAATGDGRLGVDASSITWRRVGASKRWVLATERWALARERWAPASERWAIPKKV